MDETINLTGKMLIAMPAMADPRFARALILICAHTPEGAMGLIVNKPTPDIRLSHLLAQLPVTAVPAQAQNMPVHAGGPVEVGRGFVLHSADYAGSDSALAIAAGYGLTATLDILEAIVAGEGPKNALIALGYSGWGPGQMDAEIAQNAWLICDASPELIFGTEDAAKWDLALASLGIAAQALSAAAGRA